MENQEAIIKFRLYQKAVFRKLIRELALLWRRQSGKSFELGNIGLDWMMEEICSVFYVSAAMRLGIENILKEAEIWRTVTEALRARAKSADGLLTTSADDDKGNLLDVDAIADLFEHQKLETRFWHTKTLYSRSMVVAPNPATAVGWTGHKIMDEIGRMPDFKEMLESMDPISASNPNFKTRYATTPPPDDTHYSYEFLCPPPGTEFPINPEGNFYETEAGLLVHRVDAHDGHAAGVPLFDRKTGEELEPEEHRAKAVDRQAWDRNFGLHFISGGSAAISNMALNRAQEKGADQGIAIKITDTLAA